MRRGEIWELAGSNLPVLIVSADTNNLSSGMPFVVVLHVAHARMNLRVFEVSIGPGELSNGRANFVNCHDIHSVLKSVLQQQVGTLYTSTMQDVDDRLRLLLDLP